MSSDARSSFWIARVLVSALLFGAAVGAFAQHCAAPAARVVSIQGSIELRLKNAQQWQAAHSGAQLCSGDSVRTGLRSRAALLLPNETTLRLDQGTTLTLSAPDPAQASLLDLILGTIHVISRTPRPFRVNTPYLNAGVEGTEFLVGSNEASARLAVFEGKVSATSAEGSLMLVGGEIAYAAKGAPLRKERMLRPADAVQWALYYPTLFDYRLGEGIAGTPGEAALRESIDLYRQDRLAEAIFRLDEESEGQSNPRFLTYRAGLLLLVGQADEARSDLERALAVDAGNSNAHALKSVVALTQNDKAQALKLATRAVELDQASTVARLALSYAQQAHFKIEEALASVQKAVELDSQNALAWARLAELHMSTGYLDRALESAKRAVSLNPELAKTQSVLGFANLTRIDTQAAKQAFEKAIDLDQADPLPRLGLGLAMIREGDLSAGREQLEIAVCLDPENSLLRSYVGKAYYEEKRDKLAGIQFDLAKERDPRDPTPWFYDAIRKQTENRPVEALQYLEKSIELNDNRAVYRSRLLLDQDVAARSVSLARIYADLGLEQLALAEGYKSLNADPSNYSAHRFLADTYQALPRHEIARVSELLQSQLLQPVNLNPLQPQLGEDRLFILRGAGPARTGLNEFNPLLSEDRISAQLDGLMGQNSTSGDQLVVAGVRSNLSWSLGQFRYSTDGFRKNNDLEKEVYNAFFQADLSPRTSLQMELRSSETDRGDFLFPFDPNTTFLQRLHQSSKSARLGARHSFAPGSDFIASAIYQENDDSQRFPTLRDIVENRLTRGMIAEVQFLSTSGRHKLVTGAGRLSGEVFATGTHTVPTTSDRSHTNAYQYAELGLVPGKLSLIAGLSADAVHEPGFQRNRTSPKLGILWKPSNETAVRAAAFQTVKRALIANQTIEPTQIAGFNQFFDDTNGTVAQRVGVAVDQTIASRVSYGFELSTRRLQIPIQIDSSVRDFIWTEQSHRAYCYWLPWAGFGAGVDYFYERFDRSPDSPIPDSALTVKTHRIPLSANFFNPLGFTSLSARFTATYVRQNGKFFTLCPNPALCSQEITQENAFWVSDLALSYRLPKRRGRLTVEARNLFDRRFKFQDTDPVNPRLAAGRLVFAWFSVGF